MRRIFISSVQKELDRVGTGTRDMIRRCRDAGLRDPEFALRDGLVQTLWRPAPQVTPQVTTQDKKLETKVLAELAVCLGLPTTQVTPQVAKVLGAAIEPAAREQLQEASGLQDRKHFRQTYLEQLVGYGWLERTIPEKPTSPNQKYRLTEKGRAWLATQREGGAK